MCSSSERPSPNSLQRKVILDNHRRTRLRCIDAARHGPNLPDSLLVPRRRDRVDEVLVVADFVRVRDYQSLATCFGGESLGPHVGNPDLEWSQPSFSHPATVLADSFPHGHADMLHVTPVLDQRRANLSRGPTACGLVDCFEVSVSLGHASRLARVGLEPRRRSHLQIPMVWRWYRCAPSSSTRKSATSAGAMVLNPRGTCRVRGGSGPCTGRP